MVEETEKILTVKDIQAIFGCGKNQAYEIIHANGFPSFKIGRRYYIYQKAFAEWLEKNQNKVILK
jgi:excisionase family DNA binding protein